jgi:hypothetical protein
MFDTWYDRPFDMLDHVHTSSSLGQEYIITDAGEVSPVSGATTHSTTSGSPPSTSSVPPASTLVGSSNGLRFDLIWDASVASAPSGFMQAVIDAAQYYTTLFSNNVVINIDVGWGEIAGSSMAANALGESESLAYLTNYATVTNALGKDGYTFLAGNEPTTSQFFVTSAETKALGLISGTTVGSASLDGYIGFSTLSGTGDSWNFTANANGLNSGTGSNQFDLQAVAQHEITEVMGRIGMEGATVNGLKTYTPLDLFNFNKLGVLELSGNGGYFSTTDGAINLGTYNNASAYGGDIADWASYSSMTQSGTLGVPRGDYDSYDAFSAPGYNGDVSQSDILEDAALGYKLTLAGLLAS